MMTLEELLRSVPGLSAEAVEECVSQGWVKPRNDPERGLVFDKIDFARLRLVFELRYDFEINDAAVPIVLALLDQIYDLRRVIRKVSTEVSRGEALIARQKTASLPPRRTLSLPGVRIPDSASAETRIPISNIRL
ncbi:MAG: chaperone modulator CbpM [Alphaproteobacteria bacterium]